MRIEKLHLKNFRCFKELDIQFPESNLAVFIGLNGAGKTTILDAITELLCHLNSYHKTPQPNIRFNDDDINYEDNNKFEINIKFNFESHISSWNISKIRKQPAIMNADNRNDEARYGAGNRYPFTILTYTATRKKQFSSNTSFTVGANYIQSFDNFEHFRNRFTEEVDAENRLRNEFIIEKLNKEISITIEKKDLPSNSKLNVIRKVIEVFCSNISNMSVLNLRTKDINTITQIVLDWAGQELKLYQLSEGQRQLLLLVLDIAFSLATEYEIRESEVFYKQPDDALNQEGIVLIDEIELHLHPQWQREVLPALQKTFPNIQFIVTTHSPQVLSNLKKEEVFILKDNKIVEVTPHIEGRDSNSILYELFGVEERPERSKTQLKQLHNAIDDENLSEAKKILAELTTAFGEQDTEIVRANLHLSFAEE
jgi:predicted ATP-binding protein involved in virulence